MVKIGHARYSEKGTAEGARGDQTGKEVSVSNWYDGNWTAVYRPQSDEKAEAIAAFIEAVCDNDNIGYGQSDRLTLKAAAEQCFYNVKEITERVNCDCSSLVAVACNAVGIKVPFSMTTSVEDTCLMSTGEFIRLKDSRYTKKMDYLKRGDILRKNGHTAVVLSNGDKYTASYEVHNKPAIYADSKNADLAGVWQAETDVYLREGAGVTFKAVSVIPMGKDCYNYGYYSIDSRGVVWLFVDFYRDHVKITGFVNSNYLEKIGELKK